MFNFKVYIYDYEDKEYKDYTQYGVFPPKFADLLDEQLDEAELQLRNVPVEVFQQQTPVRIEITEVAENKYNAAMVSELTARSDNAHDVDMTLTDSTLSETMTINMLVATDKSFNAPRGLKNVDGKLTYTHTLYLIEETKILERFLGEGLTFTNALSNEYGRTNVVSVAEYNTGAIVSGYPKFVDFSSSVPSILARSESLAFPDLYYALTAAFGNDISGISWGNRGDCEIDAGTDGAGLFITDQDGNNIYSQYVDGNTVSDLKIYEKVEDNSPVALIDVYKDIPNATWWTVQEVNGVKVSVWMPYTLDLSDLPSTVYKLNVVYKTGLISDGYQNLVFQIDPFLIHIVPSEYALKKRTFKDVINRCFDLIEPLSATFGEVPRFVLSDDLPAVFDDIAPEYAMTRMTLREMLKLVGGTVHGEPRIIGKEQNANAKGGWQYTVGFDMYGQTTESHIKNRYCVSDEAYADINDYATQLDSSVENLVNQLDWAQGVVSEPFLNGDKTLRSETANVRLEDGEQAFIQTTLPIYSLIGSGSLIYCGYGVNNNGSITWYDATGTANGTATKDISPYVYESIDYNNILSPYGNGFTRAYAIYYTQGEKGIKGLFFKQPRAIMQAYAKYSIINIIRAVGGTVQESDYPLLRFRVNYLPVSATRVKTHKSVRLNGIPSAITYNQGANLVESKYYGENLKGVIARLGNIERTKTFLLGHLSDIPKIGLLYDDDYYISAVRWELRPKYIKCTVGLSKDFNRLSEYVGISSNKRMWEVSERQIQRRETVYNPKILISLTKYQTDGIYSIPNGAARELLNDTSDYSLTANIKTYDYNYAQINDIVLPITSVPFGNSLIFTCQMEDNYSAGQRVVYNSQGQAGNGEDVVGWWTEYTQYGNYYGRFDRLDISIASITGHNASGGTSSTGLPLAPEEDENNPKLTDIISATQMIYDKDSREIPQISMELSAMSDDPRIIIGSALMSNSKLANRNPSVYELYLTDEKISPIISQADFTRNHDHLPIDYGGVNYLTFSTDGITVRVPRTFYPQGSETPVNTKAWAIITAPTTETITVADNDGTETTQTIRKGGEIVIAGNFAPTTGEYAEYTLYFNILDDIENLN